MATVLARRAARPGARGSGRAGRLAGLGALLAALALLVALPVAFVGLQAIFPALNQGSFAHPFAAVRATLDEAGTWPLLGNTLRFGLAVAAGSLALGVPLGALRGLVRLPGARLWDLLFLAPFLIPPTSARSAGCCCCNPTAICSSWWASNWAASCSRFPASPRR